MKALVSFSFVLIFFVSNGQKLDTSKTYYLSKTTEHYCKISYREGHLIINETVSYPAEYTNQEIFYKTVVQGIYKNVKRNTYAYIKEGMDYAVIFSLWNIDSGKVKILSKSKRDAVNVFERKGMYEKALKLGKEAKIKILKAQK